MGPTFVTINLDGYIYTNAVDHRLSEEYYEGNGVGGIHRACDDSNYSARWQSAQSCVWHRCLYINFNNFNSLMKQSSTHTQVRQVQVDATRAGQRLDNFLQHALGGLPRGLLYRLIRTGQVRVNGKRAKAMQRLENGDQVRLPPVRHQVDMPLKIPQELLQSIRSAVLHEDEHQLVLNKPAGLAVHAGSGLNYGLVDVLKKLWPQYPDLALAHRLDRETSGCLLVGFNRQSLLAQQQAFRQHQVDKRYLALLCGRPREQGFMVDLRLSKAPRGKRSRMIADDQGKPAITRFKVLEQYSRYTLVEAEPVTGRTHQIRAHAAGIGLAVAGDPLYQKPGELAAQQQAGLSRMFLHAHQLRLNWPDDILVNAPLPDSLRTFINRLS